MVSSHVKEMAVRMGLDEIISKAGGFVVPDSCPDPAMLETSGRKNSVLQNRRNALIIHREEEFIL